MTSRLPKGIRPLLAANFFSTFAIVGQITILGKEVFDLTGNALDLGLLGLAEFLPTFVLAPLTGSLADRFDRRRVFQLALLAEASCSLGLYGYVASDATKVWPIFALVMLLGTARAFAAPSGRALPVDLSPADSVERVVATNAVIWQTAIIGGPVCFGFVFLAGRAVPYLLAAVLFMTGSAVLLRVQSSSVARATGPTGPRAAFRDAFDGLRFVRAKPVLLGAISLDLFAVLFGGAAALLPAIADERLGVGSVGLGWLRAAAGAGAAVMGLVLTRRPIVRRVGRTLLAMVAIFGLGTIGLGLTRSYPVAIVALVVLGAADAVSVYVRATIVPLATPEDMRGRVLAVENVFISGSNELGAFESGLAAQLLGLSFGVVSGGIGTLVVVALWAWRFPALRDIDRFADLHPDAQPPPDTQLAG